MISGMTQAPAVLGWTLVGTVLGLQVNVFLLCLLLLSASCDNWCSTTLAAKYRMMAVHNDGY